MNRSQKVTTAVSALVVAGLIAVAAPAVASVASEIGGWALFNEPASQPVEVAAPDDETATAEVSDEDPSFPEDYVDLGDGTYVPKGGPGDCSGTAWISITTQEDEPTYARLIGEEPVDMGPREFAKGTVGLDDEGRIESYTVAPGDALFAIGDRLCFGNALTISTLNHVRMIHPGQVLQLSPDPAVAWVPYFNPTDAPAGFQQIPYQRAIEAMGAAADAGDVDAMRAIWSDGLSGMFIAPARIDTIAQALDVGDLDMLRQMFS